MINESAKKIVKYMLDKAISLGNLNETFNIRYDDLAKELNLESENHCRICCQYLNELHYIHLTSSKGNLSVRLTAKGIDFLESTQRT